MEIGFKQTVFSMDPKNQKCNDCGDDNVKFVSVNNGITLCELCAQIHKNFGNQISFIRDINDEFDDYLMNFFIYGGNKKFRRTLRHLGVNLDVKKAQLYRTYGVDFYRRNLKAIVRGSGALDKDFNNPNEVMQNDSNSFPEFENYTINLYNNNKINFNTNDDINMNAMNNNFNNNNNFDFNTNFNNNNNFNFNNNFNNNINPFKDEDLKFGDIEINNDNKLAAIENEPQNPPQEVNEEKKTENNNNNNVDNGMIDNKVLQQSVKEMKKFGGFMKKEGIKGYGLMKKYGKILYNKSKPAFKTAGSYISHQVKKINNEFKHDNSKKEDPK